MDKKTLIKDIFNKNKGLKLGEVEGLMKILVDSENGISLSAFTTCTGLPRETLTHFISSIEAYLDMSNADVVKLASDYLQNFKELGFKNFHWSLVTLEDPNVYKLIVDSAKELDLKPNRDLDQFLATKETRVAKALLMEEKSIVDGRDIAFLGDDDGISLVIEQLDSKPASIAVFDIDPLILDKIKNMSMTGIQTIQHDCRNEIPSLYMDTFNVIVTDPPYTKNGIKIFLNRAIELLGKSTITDNKYIVLFYGNSFKTPEKTLKIQEIISDMKLLIEDKIDKFARYTGADSIGNASSVYILKVTPFTHGLEVADDSDVYTHQIQKEEKFPYVDHFVFKLYDLEQKDLRSKHLLMQNLLRFCDMHKLRVVDKVITEFKGGGVTVTLVLANSNMTVHTWPELGALHIDLITCNPIYNRNNFRVSLSKLFNPKDLEIRKIE